MNVELTVAIGIASGVGLMSEFFFAWVGEPPIPAFTLSTTGDVWGGSLVVVGSTWNGELKTTCDIPTSGIWAEGLGPRITNIRDPSGLVQGMTYGIRGAGIPMQEVTEDPLHAITGRTATFTFDGVDGGDLDFPAHFAEDLPVTIFTPVDLPFYPSPGQHARPPERLTPAPGSEIVHFNEPLPDFLIGKTLAISGPGIPQDTFFPYEGGKDVTITNFATKTGSNQLFTVRLDSGRDVITNLGDTTGLVVGDIYQIFTQGIAVTTLGTFQADGTIMLSQLASVSTQQAFLRIHRGIKYPDGGAFDPNIHARKDEQVTSVRIDHAEGNFALLTIDLKNPRIGLLAPGRMTWCWLSWKETPFSPITSLFHGRLMALPTNIIAEKVTLQFKAEPADYANQQALISNGLREPPYYDPIWYANGIDTPANILEARTAEWHVGRTDLQVSISDIAIGEDGTLEVTEADHSYAAMGIKYGSSPASGIYVKGTVTYSQDDTAEIDLTPDVVKAFRQAGSKFGQPFVCSYCGDGLLADWPKPGMNMGGGWEIGQQSFIEQAASIFEPQNIQSKFATSYPDPLESDVLQFSAPWVWWTFTFPLDVFAVQLTATYTAKRSRTETVSFFLEADVQAINTDSKVESFALSSSIINEPIDLDGRSPLRDMRYSSFFKTPRGEDAFRWLLAYGKAKLAFKARAVSIDFTVKFAKAVGLSCRWNAHIVDYRIPGGEATGKVIAYSLISNATEGEKAIVTIGCSIGRGGSIALSDPVGVYAAPGYMAPGYQAMKGGMIDFGDNTIAYQSFGGLKIDDDGVNFFDMSAAKVIKDLKIINGPLDQIKAIAQTKHFNGAPVVYQSIFSNQRPALPPSTVPAPADALKTAYTVVRLEMVPVDGGPFETEISVEVSKLQIPKTINLEAPSNAV